MRRYLTITVALAAFLVTPLVASAQSQQEPCQDDSKDQLAQLVDQVMEEIANEQQTLQDEAKESGHLYVLDVAGKEVCVVLRDPWEKRAPFAIRLPKEWEPILDGTQPTEASKILSAVREGFDELVAQVETKNEAGQQIGQDTAHFQHLGYDVTKQYLGELKDRLAGSGASPEVKAAGTRLKAAADARLAGEPNPYNGDDKAEAADLKALYGYLKSIKMVYFE